jgi:hypothetical protein
MSTELEETEMKVGDLTDQIATCKNNLQVEVKKNSDHVSYQIKLSQELTQLRTINAKLEKQIAEFKPVEIIKYDLKGATVGELVGAIWDKFKGVK